MSALTRSMLLLLSTTPAVADAALRRTDDPYAPGPVGRGVDFGYADDDDDDDFGYDDEVEDFGYDEDDDFGYDDEGDEDDDDDEEDDDEDEYAGIPDDELDFAGRRSRARRLRRRATRKARRGNSKAANRLRKRANRLDPKKRRSKRPPTRTRSKPVSRRKWGVTAVGGSETVAAAGAASLQIRLQHDFIAQDITFQGSSTGATVTSIMFGDQTVWNSSTGISAATFAVTGFMRNLLKGHRLRAGLDIIVNGTVAAANDTFAATITGKKPIIASC